MKKIPNTKFSQTGFLSYRTYTNAQGCTHIHTLMCKKYIHQNLESKISKDYNTFLYIPRTHSISFIVHSRMYEKVKILLSEQAKIY